MKLRRYQIDSQEIRPFVNEHACSVFDTPAWLSVLRDRFKNSRTFYLCLENGNGPLVCAGLTLLDFKVIKISCSNFPYGGFMGQEEYFPSFTEHLIQESEAENIGIIRINRSCWSSFGDLPGFRKSGDYHHVLSLEGVEKEKLWKGYKKRIRRDIRRAMNSGVKVESIKGPEEVDILFEMYKETAKRNRTYVHWNRESLHSIYRNFVSCGKGEIIFAKNKKKSMAAVITIYFRDVCYYFLSASLSEYFSLCPNDLLVHASLERAIDRKVKKFDFMITPAGDKDLMRFKEKWGAVACPLSIYEKRLDPLRANIWNAAYRIFNTRAGAALLRMVRW